MNVLEKAALLKTFRKKATGGEWRADISDTQNCLVTADNDCLHIVSMDHHVDEDPDNCIFIAHAANSSDQICDAFAESVKKLLEYDLLFRKMIELSDSRDIHLLPSAIAELRNISSTFLVKHGIPNG